MGYRATLYDACPKCGGPKRTKNKQCASCWGYGRGRSTMTNGYVRVWCPGHPMANRYGYALEHRKVLYDSGVEISPGCHVHHINGDKADNREENLEVKGASQHHRDHVRELGQVTNQFGTHPLLTPENAEIKRKHRDAVMRKAKAERIRRLKADPTLRPHGVLSTATNWGCECQACRDVRNADRRRRRNSARARGAYKRS